MAYLIIHYSGEIGSKGSNRRVFEKKLRDNVRSALKKQNYESISITNSRIVAELKKNISRDLITDSIRKISGVSFFAFAHYCDKNIDKIKGFVLKEFRNKQGYNVKIFIPKKDENINYDSLKKSLAGINNIHSKDSVYIEILNSGCFIYDNKINGLGGLPVGCTGKLISLISGGIDSPVASYKMFRRGCSVSFIHFYNPTQVRESVKKKIIDLVNILSKYQFKTKLYIIKFDEIQRHIIANIPGEIRMIVYRRIMLKIGEKILERENAKGFITGDSLSQVASQTLENLSIIYKASKYTVFHPLIGEDKDSIIDLAKQIGTYKTSILPYDDCCSFFVAKHPQTRADLQNIEKTEKTLELNKLINNSLNNMEIKTFMH
ncbi:tRNA 4-thiouridine(8) synthase ThiI [Candidatus Woesearchaeota archaeon]|nr:tRNA 4-thiouridine(8) synthase ThiI [Candidatus Woesearchaeota archaeon]